MRLCETSICAGLRCLDLETVADNSFYKGIRGGFLEVIINHIYFPPLSAVLIEK